MKISLTNPTAGYNLQAINANFDAIEQELQNKILYRDNPTGEPNQMENTLDMNSNRILNLPVPVTFNEAARLQDVVNAIGNVSTANLVTYTPPQTGATPTTVAAILNANFNPGNATAVAGGVMKIDALMEAGTPTFPLKDEGGIWADKVHTFAGISKEFTAATGAGAFDASPSTALFAYAVNNGHLGAVCAFIGDAVGNTTGCSVFGGNFIARNASGVNGVKMVGLEIDVEFATGTTAGAGSGGLFINVFSAAVAGAALQIGGIASGTFANGIALTGGLSSTASGLFSNGLSIGSLVNTGTSTYADGAIVVSNTHRVVFSGTGLLPASIYNDASNNLRITGGATATIIRNQADTVSLLSIVNTGIVSLSSTGTINWNSALSSLTVGAAGAAAALPATPEKYIVVQIGSVSYNIPAYRQV